MRLILQDFRYVSRQMWNSPGLCVVAVLTLAVGIGATTAIFSIVEAVLLRSLPFPDPSRLVVLADNIQSISTPIQSVTAPDVRAYLRDVHTFENLGAYQPTSYEFSGVGQPYQVNAARLTAGIFPTLSVQPLIGRVFTQQEDEQKQQVTVISYSLWRNRFQCDPDVLGRKILLDRKPYLIIGVMPRGFEFPLVPGHLNQSELWVPMSFTPQELTAGAGNFSFRMVGRLKPDVTLAQAQADAQQAAIGTMRNYPAFMASVHIDAVVRPLQEDTVASVRPLLRILFLAVVVVLLIACANLAGLLLVRAIRRKREIAIRLALGASSVTLVCHTVLQSLVLSLSGGLLGLFLAATALHAFITFLPETLPRIDEIRLDWVVVAFALGLGVATGILCGLAPAFAALRTNLNDGLKEGGRTGAAGNTHARLRSTLVIAEISIALMLLAASGLLLRSFEKMRAVDPGFRPDHVVMASYSLPQQKYPSQTATDEFNHELIRRLQQTPGTESVGLASFLPMSSNSTTNTSVFIADDYVPPKGANMNIAFPTQVEGNYFPAMKIPLVEGRTFTDADKADAPLVAIVNHKLAQHYWPGLNPLGKRLRVGSSETQTPWITIVGVAADVKQGAADTETLEEYYQPIEQLEPSLGSLASPTDINGNAGFVVLRTSLPAEQMENTLRRVVRSIDPQLALDQVQTMERAVFESEAPRRFNTAVISVFAIGALLLVVLGIYSVVAFSVALRTQEMAIRMALGSRRTGIVKLVLGSAAWLAVVGCAFGVVGAIAASRLLGTFLFQISALDPMVLGVAVVFVTLLSLCASAIPARRAASTDPLQALRME